MGDAVVSDLSLGHRLQQGALRLGGGAVDLVGKHHLREHGAAMEAEFRAVAHEDGDADQVGGQQVAGELHALELQPQRARQRVGERGLAHARQVLQQQMATCQHAGQRQPDLPGLA